MNNLAINKHQNPTKYERDHVLCQDFTKPQTVTTALYQIAFQKSKFDYCDQSCEIGPKKTRPFCRTRTQKNNLLTRIKLFEFIKKKSN